MSEPTHRLFTLKTALGLFFLTAFTVPAAVTSAFFWQHVVTISHENDLYFAKNYAQNVRGVLDIKHDEYRGYFERCKKGREREFETRSPLVFCGVKTREQHLVPIFHSGINSDSFTRQSITHSPWWNTLGRSEPASWLLEAETGIEPAYYKTYVLFYEKLHDGRVLFGLLDPLPLMSALISSASTMSESASVLPILSNGVGKILFAPQSLFYTAFFNGKNYSKMLEKNANLRPLDYDNKFTVRGIDFVLHFVRDDAVPDLRIGKLQSFILYNFGLILLLGIVGVLVILRAISEPIVQLSEELFRFRGTLNFGYGKGFGNIEKTQTKIREVSYLQEGVMSLLDTLKDRDRKLEELNHQLKEREILARIGEVMTQIAHDIRSPLAALKVVLSDVAGFAEEDRLLVRSAVTRIEDIANSLNTSPNQPKPATALGRDGEWTCLLTSIVEPLLTEKRLQYRSRFDVEIQSIIGPISYGIFSKINPTEFKRVLSNLIDNSVEACDGAGKIDVSVSSQGRVCNVKVRDNGKGIPPEFLDTLGERGKSYGKPTGSGLGVFHAKQTIESWGGKLIFESVADRGTTVTIALAMEEPPNWFVPHLLLNESSRLVILDDDLSVHQIWLSRFRTLGANVELISLSQADQLREFHRKNSSDSNITYLLDYELLGQSVTGLDLISDLKIQDRSILISSHFEEHDLRARCEELGVRIIPKGLASLVPIQLF